MIDCRLKFIKNVGFRQQQTKNFEIDKHLILRDLDQLLKIEH